MYLNQKYITYNILRLINGFIYTINLFLDITLRCITNEGLVNTKE